MNILEMSK